MSAITTTAAAPAWRIAVIGLVAVLAASIGLALGSFLLTTRTTAVGGGASYVPASAPFYFEMRLEPSADQDGALRQLLGRFPPIEGVDLDQPLYAQLTERLDEMLADEAVDVSWSTDVAPWFDGHVGLAVMDIPLDALADDPIPSMVILVGVSDTAAAAASIERLITEADPEATFSEQVHDGVTIRADGDEGAYALTDDQLLIAPSAADIIVALDAHDTGTTTLAEVGEITRLTDALPTDWLAFGVYDFTDLMAAAIAEGESQSPAMGEAFAALLEHQPLRGAMAFTAGGDRLAVDVATDLPTGPFAVTNEDRGLAAEVPADTLYYAEAGNLGLTLSAVIEPMKEAAASVPEGAEQVAMIEAALGADLEELVSWIDDGAVSIGFDGSQPYGGMVLVPNDMAAAERRLSQLISFASLAGLDPSSGVSTETSEIGSVSVATIRWEDPNAMPPDPMLPIPTGVAVQIAVTDDRALIGLGETFVGRVLELDPSDGLASVARYSDAVTELGGATNTGVAWMDLTGIREAIETAFATEIESMDAAGFYMTEIRPWLMPLDRIVGISRLEGDVHLQRSVLLIE
ncbi:MAG: DUF3352 domain-containing protein [Chloroflexi bacterium]|nr:DUF3352 domain-containing protein [Chloroflexota bacterium]